MLPNFSWQNEQKRSMNPCSRGITYAFGQFDVKKSRSYESAGDRS